MRRNSKDREMVDFVSLFLIVQDLVLTMFLVVQEQGSLEAITALAVFAMGGMGFTARLSMSALGATGRVSFDVFVNDEEAMDTLIYLLGGLLVIGVSQYALSYLSAFSTAFVLAVAVSEELFFRFFLYAVLRDRWGRKGGVAVASVLTAFTFMLFHTYVYHAWNVLIVTFIAGLILCLVYEKTKRISVVMLIHVLNNLFASGGVVG